MTKVFQSAGAEMLRVAAATVLFLATGILNAPNQETALALSIAMLVAVIAAVLKVAQDYVPFINFEAVLPQPWAAWLNAFARAGLATFFSFWVGWLAAPDWATWKSALLGAVIGAASAGVRALQGATTKGEDPAPDRGLVPA